MHVITSKAEGQELRLQLRGYLKTDPSQADEETAPSAVADIAAHLFRTLRGADNLVFTNSRSMVEELTDRLARLSARERVPDEFVPHHGALAKQIREEVEARLKDRARPVTAICTSTLEMGIDIGSVASVAQVGAPNAVAALRQRLGRAGRRGGPAILRVYVTEEEVTGDTAPQEQLREELVQTIAAVNLLLDRWCEPPESGGLHLSTLIQQVLSLIAQHGGVMPADAYRALCGQGPFHHVSTSMFGTLLRDLAAARLVRQESDGLLLHDEEGERLVNHYSFFAAFDSPVEFRLIGDGSPLGTYAPLAPPVPGMYLIFAGRRWRIVDVDERSRTIELTAASGGRPPGFVGTGAPVHDRIRQEMRAVYTSTDVPVYLDATAQRLLEEARKNFRLLRLHQDPVLTWGSGTVLFPFRGDTVMTTLTLALHHAGLPCTQEGLALTLPKTEPDKARAHLAALAGTPPPDPLALAALAPVKTIDRHDIHLRDTLATAAYAARRLDLPATWKTLHTF
ncbi:helicase-related protein [Actinocorallia sp. API 0066]|uniref:helicase-related protein n=1 Tax=Actinocorallia sp. API 0066 TaxID=2896846 RepID=UPI0027DEF0C8|nr:helicase-related protein [Actinocorallia sp. API 0066]